MNRPTIALTVISASLLSSDVNAQDNQSFTRVEAASFLSAMADDVERWHLKSDPKSEQTGTLNEFVIRTKLKGDRLPETDQGQWGQWVQASLGDTYHSGAYYTAAMVQAWRATGDERYRKAAGTQMLPLIVRMARNSDTLFPEQIPTIRAGVKLKIERPMKGYIPFWWDDGSSVSLSKNGERIEDKQPIVGSPESNPDNRRFGYPKKISQHLAQSLGVMFLEAHWMQPEDKELIEAVRLHQEFYAAVSPWGKMWTVAGVAGRVCENDNWLRSANAHLSPRQAALNCRTYAESERDKRFQAPSFADGTHYRYYADLAKHDGKLSEENALFLIANGLNHSLITEAWSDKPAFEPGLERYDRGRGTWFIKNGKPVRYRSVRDVPLGSRVGPQHLAITALALQAIREKGDVWDQLPASDFPDDLIVPIDQLTEPGESAWSKPWRSGANTLEIAAHRHSLRVRGTITGESVTFSLHHLSDREREGRKPTGRFTINSNGNVTAENDLKEKLLVAAKEIVAQDGGFTFTIDVPYTRMKDQSEWINGADHHRYKIAAGNKTKTLYLLTPSKIAAHWMEQHLVRGLRNWKNVFDEKGYIPGALNHRVEWGNADKRNISHLYGYAFLSTASAQYLIYLDGKNYWDLLENARK